MLINNTTYIICGAFLAVAAILFLIPTCMIYSRKNKLTKYTYETDAEVTGVEKKNLNADRIQHHDRMWVPTFRYSYGDKVYEKQLNVGTSEKIFEVGDKVPIKVDTSNPEKFIQVNSYAHKLAVALLYTISGFFVIFAVSAYMILVHIA